MTDWYKEGKVEIYDDAVYGEGVRALVSRDLDEVKGNLISKLYGEHVSKSRVNNSSPEALAYIISVNEEDRDKPKYINLRNNWLGRINHKPGELANLFAIEDCLVQKVNIRAGDPLTYDYGVEYWVFQLTHYDLEDWLQLNPSLSAYAVKIFKEMHSRVVNYSALLEMKLYNLIDHKAALLIEIQNYLEQFPDKSYIK